MSHRHIAVYHRYLSRLGARVPYLLAVPVVVGLGLLSRTPGAAWGVPAAAGDALYAVLVYVLLRAARPTGRGPYAAVAAWLVCATIEVSQAWHPAWLDALRATRLGALVLGRGFLWSDLAAYALGVGVAAATEAAIRRLRGKRG